MGRDTTTDGPRWAEERDEDSAPDSDVLPEDAPRGAQTIPGATQTGSITPPISGWGETPADDEAPPSD
ncbi:MAG TPA: hypothetical protein VHK06_06120 [Candidatus Limnocylindria bacterium]|nr:hypothetical protein [Candidatus Limnocylindria bacterium]